MARIVKDFQVQPSADTVGFSDEFNDSSIHSNWTQEPGGTSTISEDSQKLRISDPGTSSLEWHTSFNAPCIYMPISPVDFTIKVHVEGVQQLSNNGGGLVHFLNGTRSAFHSFIIQNNGPGLNDYVRHTAYGGVAQFTDLGSHLGGCWLALVRRSQRIQSFYSTNAVTSEPGLKDMTFLYEQDQTTHAFYYQNNVVGVYGHTETGNPAIDMDFRKFRLTYP